MATTFTVTQRALISRCIMAGFGYALFAESVRASGRCTEKQQETMQDMLSRIEYMKRNRPYRTRSSTYYGDCSEHEATMSALE